jgi:hypothetical protein
MCSRELYLYIYSAMVAENDCCVVYGTVENDCSIVQRYQRMISVFVYTVQLLQRITNVVMEVNRKRMICCWLCMKLENDSYIWWCSVD